MGERWAKDGKKFSGRTGETDILKAMSDPPTDYTTLDDAQLLSQCDVHIFKSSGPGGQHRNKVSSAVRLRHRPTGLSALGDDSRSQHQNKRMAVHRLRMKIAIEIRRPLPEAEQSLPPIVSQCIFRPRGRGSRDVLRLEIGRKDHRFWSVAAFGLDVLEAFEGRMSDSAAYLGISTSNLASVLKSERHLFGAAQAIRKRFKHGPLK